MLSLTAELEAVRRAEQEELRASVEGEQRALAQAREAEMQSGHAAALRALEARHSSHLDSLESRHRSEVQALREQHRRALEQLSAELEKQRPHKDASRPAAPTGERGQELPPADGGFTAQTEADPGAAGVAQQVRPGSGRVSSCLGAASQVASDRGGGARWADGCVEMRAGPRAGGEHVPAPGPAGSSRPCKVASSVVSSARGSQRCAPRRLPLVRGCSSSCRRCTQTVSPAVLSLVTWPVLAALCCDRLLLRSPFPSDRLPNQCVPSCPARTLLFVQDVSAGPCTGPAGAEREGRARHPCSRAGCALRCAPGWSLREGIVPWADPARLCRRLQGPPLWPGRPV